MKTIRITLSDAAIRNGEMPNSMTLRIILQLYPPKVIRIRVRPPNRNSSVKMQLAACERTVATAAPATPRPSAKMKTGSSRILQTAPISTEAIAMVEKPWQTMNWFRPTDRMANTVPAR